ncbi:glycoside hydrolase family 105 protein [Paenibacillus sp. GCM10027628]|uniref:glycoside hydrolase family 88/105 protein n=1 Tax=Paenibacillus sp. GCM10027628 TaxID=3273413 RepID=UPI003628FD97
MTTYIEELDSSYYRFGDDDHGILTLLADRYMGANPAAPFTYRAFHKSGIMQTAEGLFNINLAEKLPHARVGQYAYACALVWSESERNLELGLSCLGPLRFYFNGQLAYRSNVIDEIKPDAKVKLNVDFRKGWNYLAIQMRKTPAGFGCLFGAEEAKVRILNVLSPFQERKGQAGWVFSEPTNEDIYAGGAFPDLLASEKDSGLSWLPVTEWSPEESGMLPCERIFGMHPGLAAYAWSKVIVSGTRKQVCKLEGSAEGPLTVWIKGEPVVDCKQAGEFATTVELPAGKHDVLVKSICGANRWGFRIGILAGDVPCALAQPYPIQGYAEPWLYAGPVDAKDETNPSAIMSMSHLFDDAMGGPGMSGKVYWQLDAPAARVRPYYENAMLSNKWTTSGVTNFGRWDYPLGVTMYGLLQSGRLLERPDLIKYAIAHIRACTDMYEYSLWDRKEYGFPAVNQQLVLMKMLDNCGSFGSAMLEAYAECEDPNFLAIAGKIADFIINRLERKKDGVFFRECRGDYSENTMWADDLYMSTPFLRRFADSTGSRRALDEAAKQFLLFKKYLFMPEQKIMSHVFDFKYERATGIPWGRGNGWTIFSLSEVLEVLPEEHPDRPELLAFFNALCEGYIKLQGDNGLWHQVLNDPDAYQEASCTAMFAFAFARGVRFGWLNEPSLYADAALKAWEGLTRNAIDRHGNVHGVCSGSRYSFTAEYYKEDLLTVLNDNHGIGIMMLAGTEVLKLKRWQGEGAYLS